VADFDHIPRRVFLDTCVVNLALDFGEQIHERADIPLRLVPREKADVEALCGVFDTGRRAFWQVAISPHTYCEVTATADPTRRHYLESWFFEIWAYWQEFLHSADNLPTFAEAEEIRLRLLSSSAIRLLPDVSDRVLLCDAIAYACDAFCTRDWSTILKHRDQLKEVPIQIVTPAEWWAIVRPWAAIWC
jgi:hypothetical protein